jgi:hypothetical protein
MIQTVLIYAGQRQRKTGTEGIVFLAECNDYVLAEVSGRLQQPRLATRSRSGRIADAPRAGG